MTRHRRIAFLLGLLSAALGVACSSESGKGVDNAGSGGAFGRAQVEANGAPPPAVSVFCGDGVRDPITEECDEG